MACTYPAQAYLDSLWRIEDGESLASDPYWQWLDNTDTTDMDHGKLETQWKTQVDQAPLQWTYFAQWKPVSDWRMELKYDTLLRNAEMEYQASGHKAGLGYMHKQIASLWYSYAPWKGLIQFSPEQTTLIHIHCNSRYGLFSTSLDYPYHYWNFRGNSQQKISKTFQSRHRFFLQDSAKQLHWIQSNQLTHKSHNGTQSISMRLQKKNDTLLTLHFMESIASRWRHFYGESTLQWTQSQNTSAIRFRNELQCGNHFGIRLAIQNRYSTSTMHKAESGLYWRTHGFQNELTLQMPVSHEALRIRTRSLWRWSERWTWQWQADWQRDSVNTSWELRMEGRIAYRW